jgi:dihydrofolate reductase
MSKVFFLVSVSLDGYLAPPGMDMEHASDPTYEDWAAQWGKLQSWIFPQRFFREMLKLGEGGETGTDNQIVENTFRRTGVSIMGKRMFDLGERMWPEEAPFHTPVFVLTSQVREPWVRPGGTTFYFVNDGIESALRQARAVAARRSARRRFPGTRRGPRRGWVPRRTVFLAAGPEPFPGEPGGRRAPGGCRARGGRGWPRWWSPAVAVLVADRGGRAGRRDRRARRARATRR